MAWRIRSMTGALDGCLQPRFREVDAAKLSSSYDSGSMNRLEIITYSLRFLIDDTVDFFSHV
jgi:hypothetical protein